MILFELHEEYGTIVFIKEMELQRYGVFCHMFNLKVFYIAVIDDEIAGITACNDGKVPSVQIKGKEFKNIK